MKDKYKPYIRRMNGREQSDSMNVAYRLAFYQEMMRRGKSAFVMVQKGFPNLAIGVGGSKQQIKSSIFPVATGDHSFKEWQRIMKKRCRDG